MDMEELFPLRIATGSRFCNRKHEIILLKNYIKQKRPTALISPRRYGKSSLATEVVKRLKYPFCAIDFLTAYNDDAICTSIIRGVSKLVSEIMPINMKTIQLLERCFQGVKVALRYKFVSLEFASSIEKIDPTRQVLATLEGLEVLAGKLKKSVVVFIDEFQRILETPRGTAIQGSIRHVAQTAKHVAFLFSGSSRHMLSEAFDDPNLPLYMMCEKLHLERIPKKEYIPYIQSAAEIHWRKQLNLDIIGYILTITECHPFYVNYLCSKLWEQKKFVNDVHLVDKAWDHCLYSEERRLIEELDKLALNQRILLKAIANTPDLTEPTAARFINRIKMSSGTVVPALKALKKKDMIYVDHNGITKVLDPLLRYFLLNFS